MPFVRPDLCVFEQRTLSLASTVHFLGIDIGATSSTQLLHPLCGTERTRFPFRVLLVGEVDIPHRAFAGKPFRETLCRTMLRKWVTEVADTWVAGPRRSPNPGDRLFRFSPREKSPVRTMCERSNLRSRPGESCCYQKRQHAHHVCQANAPDRCRAFRSIVILRYLSSCLSVRLDPRENAADQVIRQSSQLVVNCRTAWEDVVRA